MAKKTLKKVSRSKKAYCVSLVADQSSYESSGRNYEPILSMAPAPAIFQELIFSEFSFSASGFTHSCLVKI